MSEEKVYKRSEAVRRAEANYRAKMKWVKMRIPRDMIPLLDAASGGEWSPYLFRLFIADLKAKGLIDG